ncbi:LacI family DNA-binding transcriptional regulator [Ruania halotolerans]|uniref:LacI family DNA-binding transcriptional regulator n=1 Tax=Ruania halotolerans TaxID=2897773 RepID=UPI001E4DD513|nr:LacI family DNA-binding transcriptional regulator [Ruania halotolerans]UFU05870.1 LacI family transcriptional regulator [Ruania halotolerans]
MLPHARQEFLLRQLELHGSLRATEVAQMMGVSPVTVRRDIAELADQGRVERVHGGALSNGSRAGRPDVARTLIGVVVPSRTFYYPDVLHGMESVAATMRARIVLGVAGYSPEAERSRVERLLSLGVEGLVLTPSHVQAPEETAPWLASIPVPVVLLERHLDATRKVREIDSIRSDHSYGAMLAVDHLAALGHTRVALALDSWTPTAPWIRTGYLEAVDKLGLDPVPVTEMPSGFNDLQAITDAADAVLNMCLASQTRAVLAHSDHHAIQIAEIAQLRGLRVPEDIAVISYDDVLVAHAAVPLTAVTPPRVELGREALRMLMGRVDGTEEPSSPRHVQLLPRLTIRESCGGSVRLPPPRRTAVARPRRR